MIRWTESDRTVARQYAKRWRARYEPIVEQPKDQTRYEFDIELEDELQRWISADPTRVFLLGEEIAQIEDDRVVAAFSAGPLEEVLRDRWLSVKACALCLPKDERYTRVLEGVWPHTIDREAADWQKQFLTQH
jgi:hypothetical protein